MASEAYAEMRQALAQLIGERKLLERKRSDLALQFDRWEKRAMSAGSEGNIEEARKAVVRCEQIAEEDAAVKAQILALEKEIRRTEGELRELTVREELSVDAGALLAQLENTTGPADPAKRELDELERRGSVDAELEQLKERLRRDE